MLSHRLVTTFDITRSVLTRSYATVETAAAKSAASKTVSNISTERILPNIVSPSSYTLASLRSFPSLEPHSVIPVHAKFLQAPLRRDILWLSVTMELDNKRVGASNPPGRSEGKYSRRKLMKQKGSGRARVGDANSPTRHNGAYALARNAPNDFSTDLPRREYYSAYRIALSEQYRRGHLYIIGGETSKDHLKKGDANNLEICTSDSHSIGRFLKTHELDERLNELFIPSDYLNVANLRKAILHYPSSKIIVKDKRDVRVRDILKAHRIYIEKDAFEYFVTKYSKYMSL